MIDVRLSRDLGEYIIIGANVVTYPREPDEALCIDFRDGEENYLRFDTMPWSNRAQLVSDLRTPARVTDRGYGAYVSFHRPDDAWYGISSAPTDIVEQSSNNDRSRR